MDIENVFKYHAATEPQLVSYAEIRLAAKELARVILQHVPVSADQSAALRKVREAVMTANAGIALDGKL